MALTAEDLKRLTPALSPRGTYVSGDDYLLLTSFNSLAGVAIAIGGRFLTIGGEIRPFQDRHVPNSDRTSATLAIKLGEGWLQGITLIATGATPAEGQTFVRVDLARGDGAARVVLETLIQGSVTAAQRLAWPGSAFGTTASAPGAYRSITGTNPAAGAEISETVPTGASWRFVSLRAQLVTSATAANRTPVLTFDDGTNVYAAAAGNFNQTAGSGLIYHFGAVGQSHAQSTPGTMVSAPANIVVPSGGRIRTATGSLQVDDDWGAPQLFVEERLAGV